MLVFASDRYSQSFPSPGVVYSFFVVQKEQATEKLDTSAEGVQQNVMFQISACGGGTGWKLAFFYTKRALWVAAPVPSVLFGA
ncbi:hypothetical protein JCM33374_g904 [Metschnikowia sp. JCM 33374]|nr:hypothetical protein JCM33374_g904 [Metschnikowia sp. JCM 33374]